MLTTVTGTYKNGKIQLAERPSDVGEGTVLITFLASGKRLPSPPKLTTTETVELRGRLASWEEDWNAPGMEAYDQD